MALYSYIKKTTRRSKLIVNVISYASLLLGSVFLFWSFYPVISFAFYAHLFIDNQLMSPVPQSAVVASLDAASSVLGSYTILSTNLSDYTKAGIWFPSIPQETTTDIKMREYRLSIPKLNIKDAKVMVGGDDLSKSLIHYLPKSYPGEYGNVAIFGHSTLPQLYDPKNYKTIFTYLPSLVQGDKIYVVLDDITYEYEVYDRLVVGPDQVSVLNQQYDGVYLTLITCVPPGTYWNRLVIKARLIKL